MVPIVSALQFTNGMHDLQIARSLPEQTGQNVPSGML
jgi:hypothetical protein